MKLKNNIPYNTTIKKRKFAWFPTQLGKFYRNNRDEYIFEPTFKIWLEYYYEEFYFYERMYVHKVIIQRYQ
jgi:hypothetical protein